MAAEKMTYDRLLRYAEGDLPADEALAVEAYLADHPAAAATVERYRTAAGTVANDDTVESPAECVRSAKAIVKRAADDAVTPAPLLEQVANLIAQLIYDSRAQPALAGYRGGGTAFQLSFRSELAEIDLDAEPLETGPLAAPDQWRVIGQINAIDGPAPFNVELTRAGADTPAHRTAADEHGVFTLIAPQGRYDVRLRSGGREVVLPGIELS